MDKFVFEDGMKRLEEIVKRLEKGDETLENSLFLFEEGMGLIKKCGSSLENAEQKLKLLVKNDEPEFEDFSIKE